MNPIITAYGEALWDLLPEGPVLGGAPFNFVYRAKSLGADAELISCLGTDDLGRDAAKQIEALGFNFEFIQRDTDHPTGTVPVSFDEHKNPSYVITPDVAYDYISSDSALDRRIASSDCLCFGSLIQRSAVSRQTLYGLIERFSGSYLLYDINLRKDCYSRDIISASLDKCHIAKLNEDELIELGPMLGLSGKTLRDRAAECVDRFGLRYCLVTLGDKGLYAVSDGGESVYAPGFKVNLVDPVGAGDACTAGFIFSLLTGKGLEASCTYANAVGAAVAETAGATEPVKKEQIETKLLNGDYTPPHPEFS